MKKLLLGLLLLVSTAQADQILNPNPARALFGAFPSYDKRIFWNPPWLDLCTPLGTTGTGDWVMSNSNSTMANRSVGAGDTLLTPHSRVCTMKFITNTSTGSARIQTTGDTLAFGAGRMRFVTAVYFSALSDGTNTYTFRAGWHNGTSGAPTSGAVFVSYTHGTDSGNWQCSVADGGSVTNTSMSLAVAINTWYDIVVDVTSTAAGAGTASCTVNSTTTNVSGATLPDDGESTGASVQLADTTNGAAITAFDIDYIGALIGPTAARF